MHIKRTCGVLLHPTSLPGPDGIGSLGSNARLFVDLLVDMGMSIWQILPLTPPAYGNSPYSSYSAFAGNPLLIDCEQLLKEGDLSLDNISAISSGNRVDFAEVSSHKEKLLRWAAHSFFERGDADRTKEFKTFCGATPWLHDYALFMAIKRKFNGAPWNLWPDEIPLGSPELYESLSIELDWEIGVQKYQQWQFFRQWGDLRKYASERGIRIIGDLPFFVAYDSADVWRGRKNFLLDEKGLMEGVAGVPPDYFSKNGQLWGNPLYDWDALKQKGYAWWIDRLKQMFSMFDTVRIDHFRGFEAVWRVPAGADTARDGGWIPGPGADFFETIRASLGTLSVIAEDLGIITPEVEKLRDSCSFPGMKILQFAFDSGSDNPYLPHNHTKNSVVYTGSHDNNTTPGWLCELSPEHLDAIREYIGCAQDEVVEGMLRLALMSVADQAIIPFQDLLGLGGGARMNTPGTTENNWEWRFSWKMVPHNLKSEIRKMVKCYGRLASG